MSIKIDRTALQRSDRSEKIASTASERGRLQSPPQSGGVGGGDVSPYLREFSLESIVRIMGLIRLWFAPLATAIGLAGCGDIANHLDQFTMRKTTLAEGSRVVATILPCAAEPQGQAVPEFPPSYQLRDGKQNPNWNPNAAHDYPHAPFGVKDRDAYLIAIGVPREDPLCFRFHLELADINEPPPLVDAETVLPEVSYDPSAKGNGPECRVSDLNNAGAGGAVWPTFPGAGGRTFAGKALDAQMNCDPF